MITKSNDDFVLKGVGYGRMRCEEKKDKKERYTQKKNEY